MYGRLIFGLYKTMRGFVIEGCYQFSVDMFIFCDAIALVVLVCLDCFLLGFYCSYVLYVRAGIYGIWDFVFEIIPRHLFLQLQSVEVVRLFLVFP